LAPESSGLTHAVFVRSWVRRSQSTTRALVYIMDGFHAPRGMLSMSRVVAARQCSTLYKAMRKTLKGLLCPDQNPRHCSMFPVHVNRCRVHALVEGSCRQSLALLIIAASVAGDGTLRPPPKTGMHSHWSALPQAAGSGRANAPR
jgi:hypothetical protein